MMGQFQRNGRALQDLQDGAVCHQVPYDLFDGTTALILDNNVTDLHNAVLK